MATYKRSEITKNTILKAASKLFLEKGYTQTTIRDICKESGVSLSRVNYHFSSKSELAQVICRTLLRNFYSELKNIIKNDRRYSFVTEAIALRFIVDLIIEGNGKFEAGSFYQDCAGEGIFGEVFNSGDRGLFQAYMEQSNINSKDYEKKLGLYSKIFGASFPAINKSRYEVLAKCDGNVEDASKIIQDVYAGLFMQMLDIPHDAQRAMVEISYAYYKLLDIQLEGLTDITITSSGLLPLRAKVGIIEPLFENKQIKLKSTSDRKSIDLDTDLPED